MNETPLPPPACIECTAKNSCTDSERRQLLNIAATGFIASLSFMGSSVKAQSSTLRLVDADAEKDFAPLRPSDLKLGKPLLAFPFDAQSGTLKNESRMNKLVLIRLPEDQMAPETLSRSASGVLAYSGICTHQACEVKTWLAKENVLACFCHASKFDLLDGAKVVGGPAPKPLAAFALAMDGEFLSIAPSSPPPTGQ